MRRALRRRGTSRSASLVPVLPTEPVTRDDLARCSARAPRGRDRCKRVEHVIDDEQRRIGGEAASRLSSRDHRQAARRP